MEEDIYADYVVTENGIIKETGRGSAPEAYEYVDLKGNTLMPSFIVPHSHMTSVAYSFLRVQLDEITSIKEIQESLGHSEARTTTKYYTCTYDDDLDRIYNAVSYTHLDVYKRQVLYLGILSINL